MVILEKGRYIFFLKKILPVLGLKKRTEMFYVAAWLVHEGKAVVHLLQVGGKQERFFFGMCFL